MTVQPSPRGSSESFWLLRSALLLGLLLGVPTFIALMAREPIESWHSTARLEIHGDTWDGNLATDGERVYLMTREEINGFWGVLYVRSSSDRGHTWGEPVLVSAAGGPSAARHALTVGPDGSVWAAWSQLGEAPSTQQLVLRRSRDRGLTWDAPIRASRPDVGLVGVPALVMTAETSFVAFTDGERGTVLVQALDPDGSPTADPVALHATTRELYGDSPFFDGGLAAAAVGERGVLVMNDGSGLWRATSAGPGQPWIEESWWPDLATYAPPRLAAVDGRLMALSTIYGGDSVQIDTQTSSDGGRTWDPGATWLDVNAGDAVLAAIPGQSTVLWESCDLLCSGPIMRVGDVEAWNGRSGRIDGPAGRPAGALMTDDTMIVAWITDGPDFEAEQRTVVVATGPRP